MTFEQRMVFPNRLGRCCIYPSEIVSFAKVRLQGWNLRTSYLLRKILRLEKRIGLLPLSYLEPLKFGGEAPDLEARNLQMLANCHESC